MTQKVIPIELDVSVEAGWTIFGIVLVIGFVTIVWLNTLQTNEKEAKMQAVIATGQSALQVGCAFNTITEETCIELIKDKTMKDTIEYLREQIK